MGVEVRIPPVLRKHVGGESSVVASPGTVGEILAKLGESHQGLTGEIFAGEGELHRFVNVYVNDEDVRYLEGLDTKVSDDDVLAILPAVAGGG